MPHRPSEIPPTGYAHGLRSVPRHKVMNGEDTAAVTCCGLRVVEHVVEIRLNAAQPHGKQDLVGQWPRERPVPTSDRRVRGLAEPRWSKKDTCSVRRTCLAQ